MIFFQLSYFRCRENYKGSRCELYELLAQSPDEQDRGLLAAVVIVGVLILVVLAVIIYYVVRYVNMLRFTILKMRKYQ